MPKIEVNESLFFKMLGAELEAKLGAKQDYDKLEEILTSAKAELDEKPDTSLPEKERIIKRYQPARPLVDGRPCKAFTHPCRRKIKYKKLSKLPFIKRKNARLSRAQG